MQATQHTKKSKSILNHQDVYEILRSEILSLKILPGQALSENQMTARFNMSRTPVRNAFAQLQKDGLIEIIPKKGTYVTLIDLDAAEQTIFMRIQVEIAAMRYLARHPDAQLFARLEKQLLLQEKQIEDGAIDTEFFRLDSMFHESCMASFGKRKVWRLIQDIEVHYSRYRLIDYHQANVYKLLVEQHRGLLQMMIDGDEAGLPCAISEHLYGGILRSNAMLLEEYAHYFNQNERSFEDIVRDVKLMINETL